MTNDEIVVELTKLVEKTDNTDIKALLCGISAVILGGNEVILGFLVYIYPALEEYRKILSQHLEEKKDDSFKYN